MPCSSISQDCNQTGCQYFWPGESKPDGKLKGDEREHRAPARREHEQRVVEHGVHNRVDLLAAYSARFGTNFNNNSIISILFCTGMIKIGHN